MRQLRSIGIVSHFAGNDAECYIHKTARDRRELIGNASCRTTRRSKPTMCTCIYETIISLR